MSRNPKIETIEKIKSRFRKKREWLIIRVTKESPLNISLEGQLLAHHPNRKKIFRDSVKYKGSILIDCSVYEPPTGYVYVF